MLSDPSVQEQRQHGIRSIPIATRQPSSSLPRQLFLLVSVSRKDIVGVGVGGAGVDVERTMTMMMMDYDDSYDCQRNFRDDGEERFDCRHYQNQNQHLHHYLLWQTVANVVDVAVLDSTTGHRLLDKKDHKQYINRLDPISWMYCQTWVALRHFLLMQKLTVNQYPPRPESEWWVDYSLGCYCCSSWPCLVSCFHLPQSSQQHSSPVRVVPYEVIVNSSIDVSVLVLPFW